MFTFKIKVAEKTVKIDSLFETTKFFCKKYLVADSEPEDISVSVSREDIDIEKTTNTENADDAVLSAEWYLELPVLHRKIIEGLTEFGIMMFHGSAIAVDGEAYIFTARSGTGKSTHTRLWREYFGERAVMVNDDKPLITFKDGVAYAHGTPWNGKHDLDNNISAPIKAICLLERDEVNHIEPMSAREMFPELYAQTYRSKNPRLLAKTLPLIDALSKSAGLYKLGCNMDIEAARVAYEGMKN